MTAGKHRIAYIDGLRAVAVLLVVVHHIGRDCPNLLAIPAIGEVLRHGNHGVDLFFILSGFCLSYPALRRLRETGTYSFDVARFAAHRIVRIVPPYWISIAFFAALAALLTTRHIPLPIGMAPAVTAWDVVKQALFADAHVRFLNGSFWTLPVEFRWYFYMPLALWLWVKRRGWFWAIGTLALALSLTDLHFSRDLDYVPAFLLGIVAAGVAASERKSRAWPVAAILLLGAALLSTAGEGDPIDFISPLWYLAAFALVLTAGQSERLRSVLSARWLTATGLASYSMYLIHEPLVGLVFRSTANPVLMFVLPVAAGFAFWNVAERPFVSGPLRDGLVRWIESRLRPRSSAVRAMTPVSNDLAS